MTNLLHYPADTRPDWLIYPVVALGNFDGVHRGHLKILERVKQVATEHAGTPMVVTFDPHPSKIVRPDKAPPRLMTTAQRLKALGRAGITRVAVVRFTRELSEWSPEVFVERVLVDWLGVGAVCVGANFLFGHERAGTFSTLRTLGQRFGFRGDMVDPVRYKDFVVSSTRIRRLVVEGHVDEAGALMGHPYVIVGSVVEGRKRGRGIGFPTANIESPNELLPAHGVYATNLIIDGTVRPSITNVGVRPTFDDTLETTVETYVLDFDGDLYGRDVEVSFVQRLRDERRFADLDALREQLEADRRQAVRLFGRMSV
jgi:riboflavin kinase/FMN adenylyltransferase